MKACLGESQNLAAETLVARYKSLVAKVFGERSNFFATDDALSLCSWLGFIAKVSCNLAA